MGSNMKKLLVLVALFLTGCSSMQLKHTNQECKPVVIHTQQGDR